MFSIAQLCILTVSLRNIVSPTSFLRSTKIVQIRFLHEIAKITYFCGNRLRNQLETSKKRYFQKYGIWTIFVDRRNEVGDTIFRRETVKIHSCAIENMNFNVDLLLTKFFEKSKKYFFADRIFTFRRDF